jgi:hypothetical protein
MSTRVMSSIPDNPCGAAIPALILLRISFAASPGLWDRNLGRVGFPLIFNQTELRSVASKGLDYSAQQLLAVDSFRKKRLRDYNLKLKELLPALNPRIFGVSRPAMLLLFMFSGREYVRKACPLLFPVPFAGFLSSPFQPG